jgi:hypothetical protein
MSPRSICRLKLPPGLSGANDTTDLSQWKYPIERVRYGRTRTKRKRFAADSKDAMAAQLQFPLYALAEFNTAQTVFGEAEGRRRLLLFTTAEKASRYRRMRDLAASVVRLKETRDVRTLLSAQDKSEPFDVEIDPDEA